MAADLWTNNSSDILLAELEEEKTIVITLPVLARASVSLLSGSLPQGLRIQDNKIIGTPYEVSRITEYRFVLRATLSKTISDKTFRIIVSGADAPRWLTPEGRLGVGNNNALYILDNTPINYQLIVDDPDLPKGEQLDFYINDGDGQLPPGIELTRDGRIAGVVDPLLAIEKGLLYAEGFYDTSPYDLEGGGFDFGIKSSNGFDSFYYDQTIFDFNYSERPPKKLNRIYQFTVNVTDGDIITRRTFDIFVVNEDFFRADNTILQVDNGVFTADNTNLRVPIWLTPKDLGIKRANNYVTVPLDVIDTNTSVGFITYELLETNPDGTPSLLPPGMDIDTSTGDIAGRIPYQSEVTRTYTFSIKASRITPEQLDGNISSTRTFSIRLLGEINSQTEWVTDRNLGTLSSNIISVLRLEATTNVPNAKVLYSVASGRLPPGIQLSSDGEIVGKVNTYGQNVYKSLWKPRTSYTAGDVVKNNNLLYVTTSNHTSNVQNNFSLDSSLWIEFTYEQFGLTVFDNDKFSLDGTSTTIDREYIFVANAEDQYKYSIAQKEFSIKVNDPETTKYSNLYMQAFPKENIKKQFNDFISDPEIFIPQYIYRPSDPNFGIQKDLKIPVYFGIETKNLQDFVAAISKNHKKKKYKVGELKTATAVEEGTNNIVYEVLYLEIIDPANPSTGRTNKQITITTPNKITVDSVSTTTTNTFYDYTEKPSFAIRLRNKIKTVVLGEDFIVNTRETGQKKIIWTDGIEVDGRTENNLLKIVEGLGNTLTNRPFNENTIKADSANIKVSQISDNIRYISNLSNMRDNIREIGVTNRQFVPLWMRSPQPGTINELGYTPAVVLCYCKPGTSKLLESSVRASGFDFSIFNLDLDRYIIDSTDINSNPQYLLFANYQFNV